MEGWLEHLLYFAADAAARRDWVQAAKALDTFSACLNHGAPLDVSASCSCLATLALPLLGSQPSWISVLPCSLGRPYLCL